MQFSKQSVGSVYSVLLCQGLKVGKFSWRERILTEQDILELWLRACRSYLSQKFLKNIKISVTNWQLVKYS